MAVRVEGALELRKALLKFSPDLAKEMRVEMTAAVKPVAKEAKSFISTRVLTNWARKSETTKFPYFDYRAAKGGIGYKVSPSKPNRQGFVSLAQIRNKSASGAIFETAGRKNPNGQPWNPKSGSKKFSRSNNPNAGRDFIAALNNVSPLIGRGNERGRAIYRAWENDKGAAQDGVFRALENAALKFEERVKRGNIQR